ncbi:membrane protein [Leuconostoc litchii]|uniref:DUF1093 domain-containing protein n=1 Tax=Leuconostoc litchii TaxID=1981069 RepID=A0A6P2CMY0_9LACO|nr:YxeA family protein [Leuconostoc litchii]TYC47226.1 DUF1093 domain-containing protein [Leuconostoc litchii]GMA69207.1 membrane protein [Leuconostoc litchii]
MNRKKSIIFVAFIVILLLIIFVQVMRYYHATYVAEVAYAKVPAKTPKKQKTKNSNNEIISGSYSYIYRFNFVTKSGKQRTLDYELSGKNIVSLKNSSFVQANISEKRIVKGPIVISKAKIPNKILNILK